MNDAANSFFYYPHVWTGMPAKQRNEPAAVDDTPLLELLGDNSRARLLSAFVGGRNYEMNISEISRKAGVSRDTVYDHIDDLITAGAVEKRDVANGSRYTLADNKVGEQLRNLDFAVLQARDS